MTELLERGRGVVENNLADKLIGQMIARHEIGGSDECVLLTIDGAFHFARDIERLVREGYL